MAVNIGPKIGVDGEAEYRKQMNNIIQQAKTLSSEMKSLTSSFNASTSAEQKAAAQKGVLTKQIETQKERVALLTKGLQECAEKYGENDTRTLKWKQAVNEATAELNSMENELNDTGESLDEAGKAGLSFGDIIKANVISDAIISGLHAVADAAKQIGSALVEIGKQALSSYSDYEQLTGGIKKLFGDAYDQVIADSEQAYKTAGMSANDYMETATSFSASLISGLNGDTQKAAALTNQAITDMSDNANTFGSDISSIQNAYQGFAKQNYTMLDNLKLGYGGTQAEMARLINDSGVLGDTMEVTAKTVNDVSFDKMIEAIHVMQEQMGIAGTTAKEADQTIEGSVNSMKAAWSNLLTAFASEDLDLGTYIDSFVESVKTAASNVVPRIMTILPRLAEGIGQLMDAAMEELPELLDQAIAAMPDLLSAGASLIGKLADGIMQSLPQLKQTASDMFTSLVEGIRENLPQMISSGLETITSYSDGFKENIGTIVDAAIDLVMALADGIIQALPDLVAAIPQIVITIQETIIENAPKLLQAALELILKLAEGLISCIPTLIESLPQIVQAIFGFLLEVDWIGLGVKIIVGLAQGIVNTAGNILTAIKNVMASPIQYITGLFATFLGYGRNMLTSFASGVSGMASTVSGAISNALSAGIAYIKDLPRQALEWGKDMISGFSDGIYEKMNSITDAVKRMANKIKSYMHFSRPDTGPLRDYESWMPDFIQGMADGIYANAYKLENAVSSLAGGMNVNMSGMAAGATGGSYTVNVYPSQGMNEQQLANLVMQKMQHQVRQREIVYG